MSRIKNIGTAEAAAMINVSVRRLRALCEQGRVLNAEKIGTSWVYHGKPIVSAAGKSRQSVIEMVSPPKRNTTKRT